MIFKIQVLTLVISLLTIYDSILLVKCLGDLKLGELLTPQAGNSDFKKNFVVKAPVVETKNGPVIGAVKLSITNKPFNFYGGIPFAQPPINSLRFEPPKPLEKNWTGTYEAFDYKSACPQYDFIFLKGAYGDEDCLYLNIGTPDIKPKKPLSVLVYIYGGGFQGGSTDAYNPAYFMDHNIIMATVAYRVGAFGFLNTEDEQVKGNMGLKDQSMALRWIKNNIEYFGGDPNDITIWGQSAGGASVSFQLISELSKGLFNKAISFAGSAWAPWAIQRHPVKQAAVFAAKSNCPVKDKKEMVECLKRQPVKDLLDAQKEVSRGIIVNEAWFTPTIETVINEETFISEHPRILFEKGVNKVPYILGCNQADGSLLAGRLTAYPETRQFVGRDYFKTIPSLMWYDEDDWEVTEEFRLRYLGNEKNNWKNFHEDLTPLTRMATEYGFEWPAYKTAQAHRKHAPTFVYTYDHIGTVSAHPPLTLYRLPEDKFSSTYYQSDNQIYKTWGSTHGDELFLIFVVGGGQQKSFSAPDDQKMSHMLTDFIVDFVKSTDGKYLTFGKVSWPDLSQVPEDEFPTMVMNMTPTVNMKSRWADTLSFYDNLKVTKVPYL